MTTLSSRTPVLSRFVWPEGRGRPRSAPAVLLLALSAGAVAFTLTYAAPHQRVTAAVVNGLLVAVPMAVALATLRSDPRDRFGRLLFGAGAAFSLTVLSQSPDARLYSLGRVSVWLVEPLLLFLMLSFPSGRLAQRHDRQLMAAIVGIVAVLYLPTALIDAHYPEPSPWTSCGGDCPANAFGLLGAGTAVEAVVRPLREVLAVLAVLAVAVSLAWRIRRAGSLLRHALEPVLVIAVFQFAVYVVYQWARRDGSVSPLLDRMGWVWMLSLPAVAAAFAVGLLRRRLRVASVLERLTLTLRAPATAAALRHGLAEALEDPSLKIVYWLPGDPGHWVDEAGWPTDIGEASPSRRVTEVMADGRRVAAVVHDGSLAPDARLVSAAAAYGMVVLENTQLIAHLRASLRDVTEAEERTVAAAAAERHRIERDLHDGAQQQLVALRVNLSLLAERLEAEAPGSGTEFAVLGGQIDQTMEHLRTLASGSYPSVLGEHGLTQALRVAALESALPAFVRAREIARYAPRVEAAVYFSCLEALQNAGKHARGATSVTIALSDDGALRFEVSDDGEGFAGGGAHHGAGLRNITERLTAVGGRLLVDSAPGQGTHVIGTIPRS